MSLETECRDFSDDEDTSFNNENADTSVYWDVEDFPVERLDELRSKIEAAREKIGCRGGEVSITAYGEEKPDHDLDRYKDAGITLVPIGDYERRFNRMRLDLGLWWIDHHNRLKGKPTNLMVITKFIPEDTDFQGFLEVMRYSKYYVVLVLPCNCNPIDTPVPYVNKVWYWETLLDGGDPVSRQDLAHLIALGGPVSPSLQSLLGAHVHCGGDRPCPTCEEKENNQSASEATMSNSDFAAAKTAVFWDKEDCPVPDDLNGELVWRNIKSSLEKAGYHGPASITAYVDDETNRIQNHDLAHAGIKLGHVPGGGRGKARARHEAMRYDMWAWAVENDKSNLMVISKFVRFRTVEALHKRGWNVLTAWPENEPGVITGYETLTWSWKCLAAGGEAISKPASCPGCLRFQGTAAAC